MLVGKICVSHKDGEAWCIVHSIGSHILELFNRYVMDSIVVQCCKFLLSEFGLRGTPPNRMGI